MAGVVEQYESKGRPMKEWVALPVSASGPFGVLAAAAYEHISSAG